MGLGSMRELRGDRSGVGVTQEEIVLQSAFRWWRSHRPIGWSLEDHLKRPTVNCVTKLERQLARDVSSLEHEYIEREEAQRD